MGIGLAVVLFLFNPVEHGFYPVCMFYKATGWQCPGCGGLRAAHELLHGRLGAAFHLNPLAVAAIPLAGAWCLRRMARRIRSNSPPEPLGEIWLWAGVVVVVAFGVGRNLL